MPRDKRFMLEIRNFTTNEIDEKFLRKTAKTVLKVVNKKKEKTPKAPGNKLLTKCPEPNAAF